MLAGILARLGMLVAWGWAGVLAAVLRGSSPTGEYPCPANSNAQPGLPR